VKRFSNILVGVDLSVGDRMVGEELTPPTAEAVDCALWLAKLNSARLRFFFSLDIGYQTQRLIQEDKDAEATIVSKAEQALDQLVDHANKQAVTADHVVTFGKSWLEIVRQVLREQYDLVIIGAKHRGAVERLFIGSTGMKLLRKCPCPVWVTHPPRSQSHGAILVGHDLTEVGDLALELGASMAELRQVPLHVVHAIEPIFADGTGPLATLTTDKEEACFSAKDHITTQLQRFQLARAAEVHVASGSPEAVLLEHIERYEIDLMVMGTIARSGINGLLFGNTAERLLPLINCSVLAVKPTEFQSPIALD
jgi:universal stress protein E